MMSNMHKATLFLALAVICTAATVQPADAQLILGQENENEFVYHIDIGTLVPTPLFMPASSGVDFAGIEGLAVDDAGRTIYFTTGLGSPLTEVLYSAHYDDIDLDNPGQIRVRKVVDLTYLGETPRVTGLAWDSINNKLYTSYQFGVSAIPEGIYEVNRNTGEMTLVMDLGFESADIELSGLAHNALDGFLYATNLDFGNRFLNRIDLTQPPGSARTELTSAVLPSDAEGLAISNGDCGPASSLSCDNLVYIVSDDTGDPIKVFNLATDAFEADLTTNPFGASTSSAGAGWGPNALVVPSGANFCMMASADVDDGAEVEANTGSQINVLVRNDNCGPDAALSGTYVITLSGAAAATCTITNLFSSSGQAVESIEDEEISGTVDNFGGGIFSGYSEIVTFTITVGGPGDLIVTATWDPVGATDPYLVNNTETLEYLVRVFPLLEAFVSNISGTTSAAVPGLGAEFDGTVARPFRSPSGQYVAFEASTTLGTSEDDVVMLYDNGVGAVIARENTTLVEGAHLVDNVDERMSVNNDGKVAFAVDSTQSSDDDFIVVYNGVDLTVICQEDDIVPEPTFQANGWDYGSTQFSSSITGDDSVWFVVEFMGGGIPSAENTAFFKSVPDGSSVQVIAQETNTVPAGQAGGATDGWQDWDTDRQWTDGAGCSYLLAGDLYGATSQDDVIVVNGDVAIQEGQTLPGTGLTGTISAFTTTAGVIFAEMLSNGDWVAHGTTSDADEDWVIRGQGTTLTLLAQRGDEIFPGAGEIWDDASLSYTFRAVTANNQGDYVILGNTNHPKADKNYVIVMNGTDLLFREGDPVALDNDGVFDDDAFFGPLPSANEMILTDGGELYLVSPIKDSTGTDLGDAIITLDVSALVSPIPNEADLGIFKIANTALIEAEGDAITYTIAVCNAGPQDATDVVVNDTLPAEVVFSSGTMGAIEISPGEVEANLGTIPAYGSKTFEIVVRAVAEGLAINQATATANETDPNAGNNTAQASTTIEFRADVSVTKVDDGGAPLGEEFTYTITITNNGPDTATNVQMIDTLDPNTEFISATNGAVENPGGSGNVEATFASIPNGGQEIVEITVQGLGVENFVATNLVSVSADQIDIDLGNNSDSVDTLLGLIADIEVTKTDAGLVLTGNNIVYTVTVKNHGPATATNVPLVDTLPVGVNFVSATGGAVENPPASGNIEATIASLPSQATAVFTIVANAPTAGSYTNVASVDVGATEQIDPDDANNTGVAITRVGDFRSVDVVYTEISGHPTAEVPGAKDITGTPIFAEWTSMADLTGNLDGSQWLLKGNTDQPTTESQVLMLGGADIGSVFQQDGQPVPGGAPGELWDFFDTDTLGGFNNVNDFAFSGRVRGGTTGTLERIYRHVGGVTSEILREVVSGLADPSGTPGDEEIGNAVDAVHMMNTGDVGFYLGNIQGLGSPDSDFDKALVRWDSGTTLANALFQEGISPIVPAAIEIWDEFDSDDYYTTPDGAHYFIQGDDDSASTSTDDILVVDDVVVLREGSATDGVTVTNANFTKMLSDGTWVTRANQSTGDVVFRNGLAIAKTGDPVAGGAELWGTTMTQATGNPVGDYLVTGNTDIGDTDFDTVMVHNGTDIVVREGDPVDLDGNGKFDDDVFVRTFAANDIFYTDHQIVYFLATLRDSEGTSLGDAFLRINVGCPTLTGDLDGDNNLNGLDIQALVDCMLAGGSPVGQCKCGDFDMDDDVDFDDMDAAIGLWLGQ